MFHLFNDSSLCSMFRITSFESSSLRTCSKILLLKYLHGRIFSYNEETNILRFVNYLYIKIKKKFNRYNYFIKIYIKIRLICKFFLFSIFSKNRLTLFSNKY